MGKAAGVGSRDGTFTGSSGSRVLNYTRHRATSRQTFSATTTTEDVKNNVKKANHIMGDEHSQSKLPPTNTPIPHPPPQTTYTGLEMTPLRNIFFWSFLTKTKQERVLPGPVYGKIWPHSTQFSGVFSLVYSTLYC